MKSEIPVTVPPVFTNDPDEWNTKSCLIYITFNLLQLNRVMNRCIYIAGHSGVTGGRESKQ